MSEPTATPSVPVPTHHHHDEPKDDKILIIRMWPKTPVLYPMAFVSLLCCIIGSIFGSKALEYDRAKGAPKAEASQPAVATPPAPAAPAAAPAPSQPSAPANPQSSVPSEPSILKAQAAGGTAAQIDYDKRKQVDRTLAVIFLLIFFLSLFALCVDMDLRWAIIYLSSIVILFLVLWIINYSVKFVPQLLNALDFITPMANAQFYFWVFFAWVLLMAISYIVTRFHYVRIEPNEVVIVGGMLERQQRYSTLRMRYVKEVNDVMEHYLPFVRAGRIILSFPDQAEAVIIDNVLNINDVAKKLEDMVSKLQVE